MKNTLVKVLHRNRTNSIYLVPEGTSKEKPH